MNVWSSGWLAAGVLVLSGIATPATAGVDADDACKVKEIKRSAVQGIRQYAPDKRRFVMNKYDEKKIAQLYIGENGSDKLTCITCDERLGAPKGKRMKMQPHWHPSGKWIFLAAEREKYSPPPILGWIRDYVEGQLQNGIFTNMYATTPDGKKWVQLTDFKTSVKGVADGYTGPSITPDGRKAIWSQAADGNVFKYWPFGRWELIVADIGEKNGMPVLRNLRDITPPGMHWNEPGNFSPDSETMLLSGSTEKDAQGQDQYLYNIRTGALTNLTNSPKVWDEHGLFSPDGKKIIWMSAYPFRDDDKASQVLSIKTEFMMMNGDGTGFTRLTHFKQPGSPEYTNGIAAGTEWYPDGRGANVSTLVFPKFEYWELVFEGPCGNR